MSDQQIESALFNIMEGQVVRRLLAGNDAQCFTTAQYEEARDAWIAAVTGATRASIGMEKPPSQVARNQLRAFPLVVEVTPDVWTLRSLAEEHRPQGPKV